MQQLTTELQRSLEARAGHESMESQETRTRNVQDQQLTPELQNTPTLTTISEKQQLTFALAAVFGELITLHYLWRAYYMWPHGPITLLIGSLLPVATWALCKLGRK
jgi:hypothetical protein